MTRRKFHLSKASRAKLSKELKGRKFHLKHKIKVKHWAKAKKPKTVKAKKIKKPKKVKRSDVKVTWRPKYGVGVHHGPVQHLVTTTHGPQKHAPKTRVGNRYSVAKKIHAPKHYH